MAIVRTPCGMAFHGVFHVRMSNYRPSSYTNLTPPTTSFSPIEAGIPAPAARGISPIETIIIPDIRVPVSTAPTHPRIPVAAAQSISTINTGIPATTNQPPEIDNPSLDLGLGFLSDSGDTSFQSDANRTLHTPHPPSPKGH